MSDATLSELTASYLDQLALAGRSPRTIDHYRRGLDEFAAFAARHGVTDDGPATKITQGLITSYQLHLAERRSRDGHALSLAARNLHAAALRGLLRHGIRLFQLPLPPPDVVVVAKVGDRTMRRMDVQDFERLLEAVPKGPNAVRDRALLQVLFATGCRVSELCTLTRRRVDLRTREVEVIGKGKKVRGTFLTPDAATALKRYLDSRKDESPHLFVSRQEVRRPQDPKTGERKPVKGIFPLTTRSVHMIVSHLAKRAALPDDVSPHWLRHGRLTIIARHSGLLAAQELAGHASPQTTRRYTRITSSELKRHFDEAERREKRARG
ncbi:MAG: tyrosine-type recombinase/integrase [Chloroflexi bacterium]|nr:tyrosine-type recombinase/integrase [Chloroflexota bacterium]